MDGHPVDDVLIRPAEAADTPAIARMWEQLVAYHCSIDPRLPPATADGVERYARTLAERVEDSHTCTYVAETPEGRLIGYVLGVVLDFVPEIFAQEPSGFLADIFVEADFRRAGVGGALVNALVAWFRQRGLKQYEWQVSARNPAGMSFWRSIGGQELMIRMQGEIRPDDEEPAT